MERYFFIQTVPVYHFFKIKL